MKKHDAWRWLGCAAMCAAGVGAAATARAQDAASPNGTSPGEIAAPPTTDVVPEVRAHVMGGPPAPGRKYSATEIARSFYEADANRDGQLSRDEAKRVTILPYDFEQIDRDHDGAISRFEYQDAFQ